MSAATFVRSDPGSRFSVFRSTMTLPERSIYIDADHCSVSFGASTGDLTVHTSVGPDAARAIAAELIAAADAVDAHNATQESAA